MWLYIWGNLNEYEKNIVKLLTDNDSLTWNELLDKTKYSKSTLTKYIDSLNNKAIIKYNHNKTMTILRGSSKSTIPVRASSSCPGTARRC